MIDALPEIADFYFSCASSVWILISTSGIFAAFFALKVLDRIFHIFNIFRR